MSIIQRRLEDELLTYKLQKKGSELLTVFDMRDLLALLLWIEAQREKA